MVALFTLLSLLLQGSQEPKAQIGAPPGSVQTQTSQTQTKAGAGFSKLGPSSVSGDDIQVSTPSGADQNETVICIDPTDRNHLVGGANDLRTGAITTAFYASFDGGIHWNEWLYPKQEHSFAGDPAAAIGPGGEVYFGALELPDFTYSTSSLYVGRSLDGGLSVQNWVRVVGEPGVFADRQLLTADTSGGPLRGNLYLTWTRFTQNLTVFPIFMSSSSDQGQTWSAPRRVSESSACQVSKPAVGPNSELYVTFVRFNPTTRVMIDRSLDGGLTWGSDVQIATFDCTLPNPPGNHFCAPYVDVDRSSGPHRGTVYVVITSFVPGEGGTDILLYRSTDGAQTFAGPVAVSDELGGTSEFFPYVDVDPLGNVFVGYYDRRGGDAQVGYRVSRSSDGGQTFQPSVRVSDVKFDPQGNWIGDYSGIAASDVAVHPLWTDARNGSNDIFTQRVLTTFLASAEEISASEGGRIELTIDPGPALRGAAYSVFGTFAGTEPGLDLGRGRTLNLNFDALFASTIEHANSARFEGFTGELDDAGRATAVFDTGGPLGPGRVDSTIHFAAVVESDGQIVWVSEPQAVTVVP